MWVTPGQNLRIWVCSESISGCSVLRTGYPGRRLCPTQRKRKDVPERVPEIILETTSKKFDINSAQILVAQEQHGIDALLMRLPLYGDLCLRQIFRRLSKYNGIAMTTERKLHCISKQIFSSYHNYCKTGPNLMTTFYNFMLFEIFYIFVIRSHKGSFKV